MAGTDNTWQYFGKSDPYFGVISHEDFTQQNLDDARRSAFFDSGRNYVKTVLGLVREHLDPSFSPSHALDFGCGVGRLSIPLAETCQSVTGLDVSDGMLAEARKNLESSGLRNVTFLKSDDELSAVTVEFDFLNSFIVFQHIPPHRGMKIFRSMLSHLRDGGVGVLQFTYGFESSTTMARKALIEAYKVFPPLWAIRNLVKGAPWNEPMMQMNAYDLNALLTCLHESGCHAVHLRFTDASVFGKKFHGVLLLFQKKRLDTTALGIASSPAAPRVAS